MNDFSKPDENPQADSEPSLDPGFQHLAESVKGSSATDASGQNSEQKDGATRPNRRTRHEYKTRRATNYQLPRGQFSLHSLSRHSGVLRIAMMVGLLVFVLFAMIEAGKPENWKWMGFLEPDESVSRSTASNDGGAPKETDEQSTSNGFAFRANSGPDSQLQESTNVKETELVIPSSQPDSDANEKENSQALDNIDTPNEPSENTWKPNEAAFNTRRDFWLQVFKKLKSDERMQFYSFVQAVARKQKNEVAADDADVASELNADLVKVNELILEKITRYRESYCGMLLQLMVDASDVPSSASTSDMSWSELLHEVRQAWDFEIYPAIKGSLDGESLNKTQQAGILWLADLLNSIAHEQIRDGTANIRDIELPAWIDLSNRLKSTTQNQIDAESLGKIDMTQLLGQTNFYRGKVVSIEGTLLRAQKIQLANPIADVTQIFELWIAPRQRSIFPYCVYALEMPAGFEDIQFTSVEMQRPISTSGFLFKRRFFAAADGSAAECPLILVKIPDVSPEVAQPVSQAFQLGPMSLLGLLVAAVMIALLVVRFAMGPSRRRKGLPGLMENKVESKLKQLANDPNVITIEERLEKLGE